jgi:hypothetical protein
LTRSRQTPISSRKTDKTGLQKARGRLAFPPSTHDTTRIDDTRIGAVRPLITPALLNEWLPTPPAAQALVERSRAALSRVLHGPTTG